VFEDENGARQAANELAREKGWFTAAVKTL
jgi:hypothetical protein